MNFPHFRQIMWNSSTNQLGIPVMEGENVDNELIYILWIQNRWIPWIKNKWRKYYIHIIVAGTEQIIKLSLSFRIYTKVLVYTVERVSI
jgi:hypothetical protein